MITALKLTFILNLALLGASLSACAKPSTDYTAQRDTVHEKSYELQELDLSKVGLVKQIAFDDMGWLMLINDKGELWQIPHSDKPTKLATSVSSSVTPVASFGKVAFADKDGYFTLIQHGQVYRSAIRPSPHSAMLMLPFATIVVQTNDDGSSSLVRLEVLDGGVKAVARFDSILPDARPIQVDFSGDDNGHIAVLSHPDNTTYQHGVLGDDMEASQVQFLERHSLKPLAKPLSIEGLVFEANTLEVLPHDKGNHLVTTMSGGGHGASTIIIDNVEDELKIIAQSTPLPNNRWQSPFVFENKLYAIQMPHLVGRLVEYIQAGNKLHEKALAESHSNHAIGSFDTNLVAGRHGFATIPNKNHQQVSVLTTESEITPLPNKLPAPIIKALSNGKKIHLLLSNGMIWTLGHQHDL